jgi:hypothetical protein
MRIWCTVLRKNGTYKSVSVKAGKSEFELDDNKYTIKNYRIGKIGPIHVLRALYYEGIPDPVEFDVDYELKKVGLKIDSRAIKNATNKKILNVFDQEEFTKLEKLVIIMVLASLAVSAINLVMNIILMTKIGVM